MTNFKKGKKLKLNLQSDFDQSNSGFKVALQKPSKIKSYLDAHVVGQNKAKRSISVSVYNHYKRIIHKSYNSNIEIDKSNILLIEIDGFGKKNEEKNKHGYNNLEGLRQEDLITFGLIPELVGRLPILSTLRDLDKHDMMRVLTEPKNAIIKQYQKLFLLDGIILEFRKSALQEIVSLAMLKGAGARSLRSVMEENLLDIMYSLPDMKGVESVTITRDTICKGVEPIYKTLKKRKSA